MTSPSIEELRLRYQEAENAIKLYERISLDNLVAAVNELRYAGHHLLSAENEKDDAKREDLLLRVAHHCERAKYDAKEATIVSLLEELAEFRDERFTVGEMDSVLSDWRECYGKATTAAKVLAESGSVKNFIDDFADKAIDDLLNVRQKLMNASLAINELRYKREKANEAARQIAAEEVAKEKLSQEKRREKRDDRRHILNVALTVLGILLSAMGLLMMFI